MEMNTAEKLKENILSVCLNISNLWLIKCFKLCVTRCETCLHAEECHLKQITVTVRTINITLLGGKKCNLLFYRHEERPATSQLLC
jgi:hypothetical protein